MATNLIGQVREQAAHPADKARFELSRIERREYATKGIVRWDTLLQRKVPTQPVQLLFAPDLDGDPTVSAREDRAQRDHQHFGQVVRRCAAARIAQVSERFLDTQYVVLHLLAWPKR